MYYNFIAKENYDPERNTPTPAILPIQGAFDKPIPDPFGNAEYRAERQRLITIDGILDPCDLATPVIEYFLDVASVNKYIAAFGTNREKNGVRSALSKSPLTVAPPGLN